MPRPPIRRSERRPHLSTSPTATGVHSTKTTPTSSVGSSCARLLLWVVVRAAAAVALALRPSWLMAPKMRGASAVPWAVGHVISGEYHVISGEYHVISGEYHVISGEYHVIGGGDTSSVVVVTRHQGEERHGRWWEAGRRVGRQAVRRSGGQAGRQAGRLELRLGFVHVVTVSMPVPTCGVHFAKGEGVRG
jgi:hypothetical protein